MFAADTGQLVTTIRTRGALRSAVLSPDGSTVLTAARGQHAQLWDAHSGALTGALAHGGAASSARFSADGRLAVTARGASARIWEVASRSALRVLTAPATIRAVMFSPDGGRLLMLAGTSAYVVDVASGASLFAFSPPSPVTAVHSARGRHDRDHGR